MRRIISNTGKALHSIASEHLRQHISVHNIPALVSPSPVARWGDDKVYHDQAARVKVHFNVSTPCIYDMLTRQEQHLSTVDNNLVQEAAQQHQSVPHISLSSNWGITTRTAAGVRRHEGKEADDKRPGISTGETCGAIRSGKVQHHQSAGLLYMELALLDDMVHHGDITRPSPRYGGVQFPPNVSQSLHCMDRHPTI